MVTWCGNGLNCMGFPTKFCPAAPSLAQRRARPALWHAGYARSDPGGLGGQRDLEIRPLRNQVSDPGNETRWMARAHHDYQRAGNPVGYYAPGLEPQVDGGNTLILAHTNLVNEAISDKLLLDDTIIEVDWQGNVVWEWRCSDHFHELGFDDAARTPRCTIT